MKKFVTLAQLLESKGPEGKEWDIVVIEAGKGLNNRVYSPEVLKAARGLYEKVPVYLFEFAEDADHLPDSLAKVKPNLVRHLVGWLKNPRFVKFLDGQKTKEGIIARFHVDDGAKWLRAKLLDAWKGGLKNLFGFSHDADGDTIKDPITEVETVLEIKEVTSVDLVANPAQGGQFVRLLASQGGFTMFEKIREAIFTIMEKINKDLVESLDQDNVTDEQFIALLEAGVEEDSFYEQAKVLEAGGPFMQTMVAEVISLLKGDQKDKAIEVLQKLLAKAKEKGYPAPVKTKDSDDGDKTKVPEITLDDLFPEAVEEADYRACMKREMKAGKSMKDAAKVCKIEAKKESTDNKGDGDKDKDGDGKAALDRVAKVEETLKKTQSAAILEEVLGETELFTPVKDKIRAQFKDKIFEKTAISEAVKAERDTLAKLTESGNLTGLGETRVKIQEAEADKKQIAMDLVFDQDIPDKDRKGQVAFRGIKEAYKAFNPKDPEITFEAGKRHRITEATMVTGDFDNALGTSITRRLLKLYKELPIPWREFVNIVPVDNFKEQERIRWGGFGQFPTVAESGAYADIAFPTDEKAVYTALKKGGLFSITREMIKNDDMNVLRQIPRRLARAAAKTLSTFVWSFLINNSTIYDGAALFTTGRGNLGSSALDFDTLDAAVTALKGMREKGNYVLEGTATGAAAGTLIDSGAPFTNSWASPALEGYFVRIVYGTGVGQYREIASHNTTTLTLSTNWTVTPSTDSKYEVFQYLDEKIGMAPAHLAVPTELDSTAQRILKSDKEPDTVDNNVNVMKDVAKKMVVPQLVDANDWYLIADKTWLDLFEIGFIDGKEDPVILVQDMANVGVNFTHDRITYKVRHEYGGAPVDYRGFYKGVS